MDQYVPLTFTPRPIRSARRHAAAMLAVRRVLACAACFSFALSAAWFAAYYLDYCHQRERRTFFAEYAIVVIASDESSAPGQTRFDFLRTQNSDTLGWLSIPALGIEEPVVAGRDNSYYLSHDFDGAPSRFGAIFLDRRCAPSDRSLILYGHAARDGSMFGGLKAYRDEAFLRVNPRIRLDTPEGANEWEIVAVLLADPGEADSFFAWQREAHAGNVTMDVFAARCRERAICVGAADVGPEARLLSLVTCAYDFAEARLVILAMEVIQ